MSFKLLLCLGTRSPYVAKPPFPYHQSCGIVYLVKTNASPQNKRGATSDGRDKEGHRDDKRHNPRLQQKHSWMSHHAPLYLYVRNGGFLFLVIKAEILDAHFFPFLWPQMAIDKQSFFVHGMICTVVRLVHNTGKGIQTQIRNLQFRAFLGFTLNTA